MPATHSTRHCNGCNRDLPSSTKFWSPAQLRLTGAARCRACRSASHKRYNQTAHGRRVISANRRSREFNLDAQTYTDLWQAQGGVCRLCRKPETRVLRGHLLTLAVDHDHTTGKVRGLLCNNGNRALGLFRDDPQLLRAAANYVAVHRWLS